MNTYQVQTCASARKVRPERTFENYSRGGELVQAIRAMWRANNKLPAGSNAAVERNIQEVLGNFDLTIPEWHYWCKLAMKERV
jgi:hypothetical protein